MLDRVILKMFFLTPMKSERGMRRAGTVQVDMAAIEAEDRQEPA